MLDALFLPDSPWTRQICDHATYSSAGSATSTAIGLDTWLEGDPWSLPVYSVQSSDPARPLLYNANAWNSVATGEWKRFGNDPLVEQQILNSSSPTFPFPGNVFSSVSTTQWVLPRAYNFTANPNPGPITFQVGPAIVPAPGTDGHMAVQQQNGEVLETYGTIILSTGQVIALSYAVTDPKSRADGWQNGQTVSMIPVYAGVIDDAEFSAGHIDHAMAVTLPAKLLSSRIRYPAYAFDRDAATANPPYSGNVPMGARLALPLMVDIASMHLSTKEGKIIAAAAQKYGFLVVDRGGDGISIRIRRNSTSREPTLHAWNWPLQSDLDIIRSKVKQVDSCDPE